jgi:hypothetical protein
MHYYFKILDFAYLLQKKIKKKYWHIIPSTDSNGKDNPAKRATSERQWIEAQALLSPEGTMSRYGEICT